MVEPGDTVSRTLKKEFGEEAMNSMDASETEKIEIERHINELFKGGTKVGRNPWGRNQDKDLRQGRARGGIKGKD